MAVLLTPVSGPYVGTWNAYTVGLGTQDDDGYAVSCTVQGQEVNASDAYGMTLIETIYRGQNWRVNLRGLEWAKGALLTAHHMFGTTQNASSPSTPVTNLTPTLTPFANTPVCNVGDVATTYAKTLLLTAILTGGISVPLTLSATFAGLSPNSQISYNLTSKLREMPLEFVLYPYTTTISAKTFIVPFTST